MFGLGGEELTIVLVFLLLFACYPIPAIVAVVRKHKSKWGIVALNLLLGWSAIGWIVALVWALSYTHQGEK